MFAALLKFDPHQPRDANGRWTKFKSQMAAFKAKYPAVATNYPRSTYTEMGSIEAHTSDVGREWAKQLSPDTLAGISERFGSDVDKLMEAAITLHDIGKAEAVESGEGKHAQHEHTIPILQKVLRDEGFSEKDVALATELLNHDLIGPLFRGRGSDVEVAQTLTDKAQKVGMNVADFVTLQLAFYQADASAYPYITQYMTQEPDGKWTFTGRRQIAAIEALKRVRKFDPNQPRDENGRWKQEALVAVSEKILAESQGKLGVLDLRPAPLGDVELETIAVAPGEGHQGVGTRAMESLVEWADSVGVRLVLSPSPKGYQPILRGPKTTSTARLKAFYKRFGFVEPKGRHYDPTLSSPLRPRMFRDPKKATKYDPQQPRDEEGQWTKTGGFDPTKKETWYRPGGGWHSAPGTGEQPYGWSNTPDNYEVPTIHHKVIRGANVAVWGGSHSGSSMMTGESAKQMGIDGYRNMDPHDGVVTLTTRILQDIANDSIGSEEPLYHSFENVEGTTFKPGDTMKLPLTAAAGHPETGYGIRSEHENQAGPPTVFAFPKGTKMVAYGMWPTNPKQRGYEDGNAKEFGHVYSEAIVAGQFRVTKVETVYMGSQHSQKPVGMDAIPQLYGQVVHLEPIGHFNPKTGKWERHG